MADSKISALTAATTPLAGTEVLPIVQSGSTKNVATNDLTVKNVRSNATTGVLQIAGPGAGATRTMTVPDANFTAARTDATQTFAASQTIGSGSGYTALGIDSSAAGGGELLFRTGGSLRWNVTKSDAETGSDAGGNFYIFRYTDAGGYGGNPLSITRSNGNVRLEGNLVIGNSGRGIDFSATTEGSGTMTSELLADYEEGTWTPTDASGAGLTLTTSNTKYTKIGNTVFVTGVITWPSTVNASAAQIGGLPFTSKAASAGFLSGITNASLSLLGNVPSSSASFFISQDSTTNNQTNAVLSTKVFAFSGTYLAA